MPVFLLVFLWLSGCADPAVERPGDDTAAPEPDTDEEPDTDTDTDDTAVPPDTSPPVDTGPFDHDGDGFAPPDDCDDDDATVHPDAEDADCRDGIDSDCDGLEVCDTSTADHVFWDGDFYSGYFYGIPDVDGDGKDELYAADSGWDYEDGKGRAGILWGASLPSASSLFTESADLFFDGWNADGYLGFNVAASDLDGDGLSDLLLGEIYEGPQLYLGRTLASATATGTLGQSDRDGHVACEDCILQLLFVDDLDGDEVPDLVASGLSGTVIYPGGPLVEDGRVGIGDIGLAVAPSPDLILEPAADDFDGDGLPDLVLGDCYDETAAQNAGQVHVLFGSGLAWNTSLTLDDSDTSYVGQEGDNLGCTPPITPGDVDGDGLPDLVMGVPNTSTIPNAAAVSLTTPDPVAGRELPLRSASWAIVESDVTDVGGSAALGDWDGDGGADLLVGAVRDQDLGGAYSARVFLSGDLSGSVDYHSARLAVVHSSDLGVYIASPADWNGDGRTDFMLRGGSRAWYVFHAW